MTAVTAAAAAPVETGGAMPQLDAAEALSDRVWFGALREAWVAAAWAGLSPLERTALVKRIKRGERLHEL